MVRVEQTTKVYRGQNGQVTALDGATLVVAEGEFVAVRGPSGSGKSTLLLTIGGMVTPTTGRVFVGGTDVYALSGRQRARFRSKHVGFVFQMFHLVPYLNVLENVMLPALGAMEKPTVREACDLLERFGMSHRLYHKPGALSTGERQRAAMARALIRRPPLLLADEPTGNLDPDNAAEVMLYLKEFHRQGGTIVLVSHADDAGRYADRTVHIRGGRIESST